MQIISPVSGWALDYVVEIDEHVEGSCRSFLRASDERRQVVAALLSTCPPELDMVRALELGCLIQRADHRSILTAAFGAAPNGLRGALARAGPQPHARSFYSHLFSTMAHKAAHARIVKQLPKVDFDRLKIVELIPIEICTPTLVARTKDPRTAADIRSLFDLLTRGGIDCEAFAESLARVGPSEDLAPVWEKWALKCAFPPHPVPRADCYLPVTTGVQLRRLAIRYRNCARGYLSAALEEQSAFAEFTHEHETGIVHLCRNRDEWVFDNLFGKQNAAVSMQLRQHALEYLATHGVYEQLGERPGRRPWNVLRRLTRTHFLFDFEI